MRWSESDQAFGLLFTAIFLFLFLRLYWREGFVSPVYGGFTFAFFSLSIFFPKALSPLKFLWMKFGEIAGRLITPIIMGFLFFIPLSGLAVLMRIFRVKYMPITLGDEKSYWVPKEKSTTQDFSKQF